MKALFAMLFLFASFDGFAQTSIYDYHLPLLSGDTLNLNDLRGKLMLIVNTSSGDTSSVSFLSELDSLAEQYQDSGLVIIAVPSNDFGNEPDSANVLNSYSNYSFKIISPQIVTGDQICPLYGWLTNGSLNGVTNNRVLGDFRKFLVNGNGRLVGSYSERARPFEDVLIEGITLNK